MIYSKYVKGGFIMNRKAFISAILALSLCAGMSVTASAIYDPMKAMEDNSRRAVATAISEGKIPSDATIFDCAYSKDAHGVTRVVQYRDASGVWIDLTTGNAAAQESPQLPISTELSAETLADYADEVFRMVNEAREQAGLPLLERTEELDEAAAVRAGEYASIHSIRVDGKVHTRLDGSKFSTVLTEMDISWSGGASENSSAGRKTPDEVMTAWLDSEGHRANILRENRTHIGIAVRQASSGRLFWIQLFATP
jgi:uncharacterized protein YkwD